MPDENNPDEEYQPTRAERLAELAKAQHYMQEDYSSILKYLLTLSSSGLGFLACFAFRTGAPASAVVCAFCLVGTIILTLGALAYSVWAQDDMTKQLANFDIAWGDIKPKPNCPQVMLSILAALAFIIAFIFIAISFTPDREPQQIPSVEAHVEATIHA